MNFDLQELNKFIVNAHVNGYAASGEGGEKILPDGGKELEYGEGDFFIRDRYFGFKAFIGEEVIFFKQQPVWGMNYYGKTVSERISSKEIYSFLKVALKKATENFPFRGPANFKDDDYEYLNSVDGQITKFSGQERIVYKDELVYMLDYHGGFIENKT